MHINFKTASENEPQISTGNWAILTVVLNYKPWSSALPLSTKIKNKMQNNRVPIINSVSLGTCRVLIYYYMYIVNPDFGYEWSCKEYNDPHLRYM